MTWHQLSINKPHLVYIILGGFTSLFMLCSLFVKEKLYIGEATVATICGVIFGPHGANLIDPNSWGNVDQITLEFSRIVLVVQCFAVGVELPRSYMERHWKSVVFLLLPVMTFGWLITSVFIWWMIVPLTWLEALAVSACVTATDPVLASSVVGKGKFAKRVPKHLRDVLSAESGCNDGMAFPFIYLSLYLLRYDLNASEVVFHWTCYTILYECIFGAFYGFMVGYIGRYAIRWAENKGVIDRESFLVFYFVLALFCAGSGSMLGMDDLLIGFSAGVGFSNDGWFSEKTEESHVSNVIDLLINLAYFVYFGTIIPWDQYNVPDHGITPWRLAVIGILVVLFRRIPIMMALKPIIPDVKTWREALFAGHFGPIGVGAIFAAILARAELETDSTTPLRDLPLPGSKDYELIYLVWPVVTFLVIVSILVHGSSIAVFTLGKRINTLTLTLSYTQDNENGPSWMNRLPRIASQSKSQAKSDTWSLDSNNEKVELPPGTLPPTGIPRQFLRRQKEEEYDREGSRTSSLRPTRRRKKKSADHERLRPGGPVDQSAIAPQKRLEPGLVQQESGSETLNEKSGGPSPTSRDQSPRRDEVGRGSGSSSSADRDERKPRKPRRGGSLSPSRPADVEVFEEKHDLILEDTEGNVLKVVKTEGMTDEEKVAIIEKTRKKLAEDTSGKFAKHRGESHGEEDMERDVEAASDQPKPPRKAFGNWKGWGMKDSSADVEGQSSRPKRPERKRGPAHAYQFGNTVIVEDEDGEVIKTYTLPSDKSSGDGRRGTLGGAEMRRGINRMSTWVGLGKQGQTSNLEEPSTGDGAPEVREGSSEQARSRASPSRAGPERFDRRGSRAGGEDSINDTDDGLRMTVSRTETYGLMGRQKKNQDGVRGIEMGAGRRMSTRDFIMQMQQLDPKSKIERVERSNAPDELKREVRRDAEREAKKGARPGPQSPAPISEDKDEGDYFAPSRSKKAEAERGQRASRSDDEDEDQHGRPSAYRTDTGSTADTAATNEDDEEDIPTHNVAGTLARYGKGSTAADNRRQRLSTINSGENMEAGVGDEQGETAAEKRRRLAALGMASGGDEESSSEEDSSAPRWPREAPGQDQVIQPKRRVQWGGESGREAAEREAAEREAAEAAAETWGREPKKKGMPGGAYALHHGRPPGESKLKKFFKPSFK